MVQLMQMMLFDTPYQYSTESSNEAIILVPNILRDGLKLWIRFYCSTGLELFSKGQASVGCEGVALGAAPPSARVTLKSRYAC